MYMSLMYVIYTTDIYDIYVPNICVPVYIHTYIHTLLNVKRYMGRSQVSGERGSILMKVWNLYKEVRK